MLTRDQVVKIINTERDYQDLNYTPEQILSSGQSRRRRDLDVTPGLVLLDSYVRKAQDAWVDQKTGGSTLALQQVAKIAAIAVRILEHAGGSEILLTSGLR